MTVQWPGRSSHPTASMLCGDWRRRLYDAWRPCSRLLTTSPDIFGPASHYASMVRDPGRTSIHGRRCSLCREIMCSTAMSCPALAMHVARSIARFQPGRSADCRASRGGCGMMPCVTFEPSRMILGPPRTFWRMGGRWLRPHAVMVRGRTGVRRRGESREPPSRLSVAWMPQEPAGTA